MVLIDKSYFFPHGILKCLQAVVGLVVMSLISSGRQMTHLFEPVSYGLRSGRLVERNWGLTDSDYYSALLFTLVASIIILLLTITLFLCLIFKAHEKLLVKQTWRIIDFGFACISTLLYLIMFVVLAIYCAHPKNERTTTNEPLVGACVLALFITALYAFAAYRIFIDLRTATTTTITTNVAVNS